MPKKKESRCKKLAVDSVSVERLQADLAIHARCHAARAEPDGKDPDQLPCAARSSWLAAFFKEAFRSHQSPPMADLVRLSLFYGRAYDVEFRRLRALRASGSLKLKEVRVILFADLMDFCYLVYGEGFDDLRGRLPPHPCQPSSFDPDPSRAEASLLASDLLHSPTRLPSDCSFRGPQTLTEAVNDLCYRGFLPAVRLLVLPR